MLFPRSHAWTARQKALIVLAVLFGLIVFAGLVYSYERYYRGMREAALVGTWTRGGPRSGGLYYQFRRDGTLVVLDEDRQPTDIKGKWYAGGPNIYLRFPSEVLRDRQLVVWHIVNISPDQFRVRAWRDGEIMIWHRVMPSKASNKARGRVITRRSFWVAG
jgi:hypothetical protein